MVLKVSTPRVIGYALITSISLGLLMSAVAVLVGEPKDTVVYSLTTPLGLGQLFAITTIASLPISIPTGIAGGVVAARVLKRVRGPQSLVRWVGRGCLLGTMLGFLGAAGWFVIMNIGSLGSEGGGLAFSLMATMGALTGSLVGSIVGAYCSQASRPHGGTI
jgi:hypothetical protein